MLDRKLSLVRLNASSPSDHDPKLPMDWKLTSDALSVEELVAHFALLRC